MYMYLQVRAVTEDARNQRLEAWSAQEWAALAQLTKLTRLHIDVETSESKGHDGFYDLLKGLKGLRVAGAWVWDTSRYLPVLQGMTQLTEVYGGWSAADESVLCRFVCPQVREMCEACGKVTGTVPFAAFPGLSGISFYVSYADDLLELSRCCTALQRLQLPKQPIHDSSDVLTSAFRSLVSFKHLAHLQLPECGQAALAAVVSAAAAAGAGAPKLQYLHIHGLWGLLDLMQLPQLVSVCCVKELSVVLKEPPGSTRPAIVDVGLWLVGLSTVPKVSLAVGTDGMRVLVQAAKLWASDSCLPLPALLRVSVVPDEQAS
jgi:hypothetical protein